jgi:preprotein translocase subunit SecB
MEPSPLNASPLRLHGHRFTEVSMKASAQEAPKGGFSLRTHRSLRDHAENPRMFLLILQVELGASTPDQDSPYSASLTIEGEFEVSERYTAGPADELVNVTGASMLYGACREMLANLTARSIHGMSTLPSVSFASAQPAAKAATKKVAAKKAVKRKA